VGVGGAASTASNYQELSTKESSKSAKLLSEQKKRGGGSELRTLGSGSECEDNPILFWPQQQLSGT